MGFFHGGRCPRDSTVICRNLSINYNDGEQCTLGSVTFLLMKTVADGIAQSAVFWKAHLGALA